jgi:hypothetical protein
MQRAQMHVELSAVRDGNWVENVAREFKGAIMTDNI